MPALFSEDLRSNLRTLLEVKALAHRGFCVEVEIAAIKAH